MELQQLLDDNFVKRRVILMIILISPNQDTTSENITLFAEGNK